MSRTFMLVLAAGAALAAAAPAGPALPAASCTNVAGTFTGFAVPVFSDGALVGIHIVGTGTTGSLGGAVMADLTIERILPGGTVKLSGTHRYPVSPIGPLETADEFVSTPGGRTNNHSLISAGGTGFIHAAGTVDFTTGVVSSEYRGRICSA